MESDLFEWCWLEKPIKLIGAGTEAEINLTVMGRE